MTTSGPPTEHSQHSQQSPSTDRAPSAAEPCAQREPVRPSETPSKLVLNITRAAIDAIAVQITRRGRPDTALRVGIRGGGCSGFSYVIEFHDGPPNARDVVFEHVASNGAPVRVVVDKKSLLYLSGSTLEWEKTLMRQGFKFVNPNEKSNCGCGTSFTV